MASAHLNVTQFQLFESGTYETQYRRPITTTIRSDEMARVQEATSHGANLSAGALARVGSEILMPCTNIEGSGIIIPNGWQTKRYHFMMEIQLGSSGHGNYRKVLSGYTDFADISHGGHLPPEMRLFINSHLTLRDVATPGPHGMQYVTTIVSNDQLLIGNFDRFTGHNNDHSIRPYDVMLRLGTTRNLREQDEDGTVNFDLTTTFSQGIKNNARRNTNPGTYLSRLLTACKDATQTADNQYLDDQFATMDAAAGMLPESLISDDAVLSRFNRIGDFANTGSITLMQLDQLAPGVEDRAVVHRFGGVHATKAPHAVGQSNHWTGTNLETILAARIAQSLPGILLDNAINRMSLVMTNMNVDGSYTVMPAEHTLGSIIKGIDLLRMAERIKVRILNELMPGITRNNLVGVYIIVDCDTMSDTSIKISIEGAPPQEFVSPTFADALTSPVVTGQVQLIDRIVHDIDNLSNNLGVTSSMVPQTKVYQNTAPQQPMTYSGGLGSRFR